MPGFFDWLFNGKEIEAREAPYTTPWAKEVMASWLFSPFVFNEEANTWEMRGLPPYPGQISPNLEETILPELWKNWKPTNQATDYMSNALQQGFNPSQQMEQVKNNMLQYGGPGGQVTDQMWKMAQWGGAGQKGQPAMDMIMQYGSPSQVGQYLSNAAQFGIPSEAGRLVANRAQGMPVSGATFLQGYGQPAPFATMPWMMPRIGGR